MDMPAWNFIVPFSIFNLIIVALIWAYIIRRLKNNGNTEDNRPENTAPMKGDLKIFRDDMEGLVEDLNLRISENMPKEKKRFSAQASGNAVLFSFGEESLPDKKTLVAEVSADPEIHSVHCVFIYKGSDEYISCGDMTIIKAFARMRYNLLNDYILTNRAS